MEISPQLVDNLILEFYADNEPVYPMLVAQTLVSKCYPELSADQSAALADDVCALVRRRIQIFGIFFHIQSEIVPA